MKEIAIFSILVMILLMGCAPAQNSSDSTGLAVGSAVTVDQVEEATPEVLKQKQEAQSEMNTVDQTKEPTEEKTLKYACPDGSWVANPDECLKVSAGKDDVIIFE